MQKSMEKPAVRAAGRRMSRSRQDAILGYMLILPAVILVLLVGILPILNTFRFSFEYYRLTDIANRHFVGLQNYIALFTTDTNFWDSLRNTFVFAFFSVLLELVVGFTGAMLMHRATRGVTAVRAAVLIPWAIPGVIVAQMWGFMFNDQLGVLNQLLQTLHITHSNITWLADGKWAMVAVVLTDTWKQFPFVALMLLAGLQTIPRELYEAAEVDGANKVRQFFAITLPGIKPILLVVLLFRTMGALRIFDIVYTMTGGGPANATTTLLLQSYNFFFKDMNYGAGSAMATIIFLLIMLISFIYIRIFKSDEE